MPSRPVQLRMSATRFAREVRTAIRSLPEPFATEVASLVVSVERVAPRLEAVMFGSCRRRSLLGMYRGLSVADRGISQSASAPDMLVIFRRSVLRVCRRRKDVRAEIVRTVYHEFGHHLGLNEDAVGHL
jgi:predicted Zn-dependent protease with MMP-like domain